ncbi:hypothetical protein [Parabacteroides sp. ZJ-118]|nr:hypothetical protein [Parabacteroides sp. ZJ-118]
MRLGMKYATLCGLPVVKVEINFSTEKRTIEEWKIEDNAARIG